MIRVDNEAANWVGGKLNTEFCPPFIAVGIFAGDEQTGGVVFNDYNGSNIELTAAGAGAFTPEVSIWIARYVFGQLGCRRITVRTKPENKAALWSAKRFGWKLEGLQPDYYPDGDAVILGLRAEDLPDWIKRELGHEVTEASSKP